MNYRIGTLKRMGKYAASFAVLGMTAGILILTARNFYQDYAYPEEIRIRLSPKQKDEYIAHENKIYCTVFAVSGLIGLVSGTLIFALELFINTPSTYKEILLLSPS